jgi:hypothetical protein
MILIVLSDLKTNCLKQYFEQKNPNNLNQTEEKT